VSTIYSLPTPIPNLKLSLPYDQLNVGIEDFIEPIFNNLLNNFSYPGPIEIPLIDSGGIAVFF
jgi:hypothetical protein